MAYLSIALVIVAALAHDAFRRWLARNRQELVDRVLEELQKVHKPVNDAHDNARSALHQVEEIGRMHAELMGRVGLIEKQLVARRGA